MGEASRQLEQVKGDESHCSRVHQRDASLRTDAQPRELRRASANACVLVPRGRQSRLVCEGHLSTGPDVSFQVLRMSQGGGGIVQRPTAQSPSNAAR